MPLASESFGESTTPAADTEPKETDLAPMDAPWLELRDDASRLDLDADSTIVDAVLAFIDDSEDISLEPAQTSTDSSSSPTKPKSAGIGKNTRGTMTFHQRQQAEIKRLRADVLLLEDQLLKARNCNNKHQQGASVRDQCSRGRQQGGLAIETPSIQPTMQSDKMKIWENMATRHKQLAMASRQENKRLRELVADQERAIRDIRRTLRRLARRQVCFDSCCRLVSFPFIRIGGTHAGITLHICKAETAGRVPRPIRGGVILNAIYREDAVVAQLCGGVVQLYKTSDLAFQLNGLQNVDTLPLHERVHQLNPTTSIAQIVCSHLLPFGFRDTRKALGDSKAVLCLQTSTLHDHVRVTSAPTAFGYGIED